MENRIEAKPLTDEQIAEYYLALESKETFEERRELILSILDNPHIAVDKPLAKMLKTYKEDMDKIYEENKIQTELLIVESKQLRKS